MSCSHSAGVFLKYDGGRQSVLCDQCRTVLATGGVAGQAERNAHIRAEVLAPIKALADEWEQTSALLRRNQSSTSDLASVEYAARARELRDRLGRSDA